MSIIQQDYILRMVEMMGEVLLAALKLKKAGAFFEADQTLTDALLGTMPDHADLVELVDERTAVSLLGDPRLIEVYLELLLERADIKAILGEEQACEDLQRRALRCYMVYASRQSTQTPNSSLLYGRMSGLELRLLLDEKEALVWDQLGKAMG